MAKTDADIISMLIDIAGSMPKVNRATIASCIVHKGRIVAWGFNQMKSHPFQARFGRNCDSIFLHAEIDAIKNALKTVDTDDLAKSTLYVARSKRVSPLTKQRVGGLAKPCAGCARAIATFNIKRTVWSLDDSGFTCTA